MKNSLLRVILFMIIGSPISLFSMENDTDEKSFVISDDLSPIAFQKTMEQIEKNILEIYEKLNNLEKETQQTSSASFSNLFEASEKETARGVKMDQLEEMLTNVGPEILFNLLEKVQKKSVRVNSLKEMEEWITQAARLMEFVEKSEFCVIKLQRLRENALLRSLKQDLQEKRDLQKKSCCIL